MDDPWQGNILIVDDTPANLQVLRDILGTRGYKVRPAPNALLALRAIAIEAPELILLDIKLPDLDGYDVCQKLKADASTCEIPVIFISALYDELDKVRAFESGGVDYIVKPFQSGELIARVENQLRLSRAERQVRRLNSELEDRVTQRTAALARVNRELEAANTRLEREIRAREFAHEQLLYQALRDPLTGLPNRTLLSERLEFCLQRQKQDPQQQFALLFLDLDRFKVVNDSLGHATGDRVLVAVARRLQAAVSNIDLAARLGGDEFVVLLTSVTGIEDGLQVAEKLVWELQAPIDLDGQDVVVGASIGVVLSSDRYQRADDLLRDADLAMYRAKARSGAPNPKIVVFNADMHVRALHRLHLESDLYKALQRGEFCINYQPIVSLPENQTVSLEALVRWQHPTRGPISPGEFIPIAEETGAIVSLDRWILRTVCQTLTDWRKRYPQAAAKLKVSVNLCARDLQAPGLLAEVDRILATGLPGHCLVLEIVESMLVENLSRTASLLEQLKDRQIHLSIDDFGTGYSSLSYLHQLPVDSLKIDRSFVSQMQADCRSREIVETVIALSNRLGVAAIAEGIETQEHYDSLVGMGCELGQGYFFSHPLPSDAAEAFLFGADEPSQRPTAAS